MITEEQLNELDTILRLGFELEIDRSMALIAEIRRLRAPQWRSMDDAPKDGTDVLLLVEGHVRMSSFNGAQWAILGDKYDYWINPTHWQPIPEPPKEGK